MMKKKEETGGLRGPLDMLCAALLFSTGGVLCKGIPWGALAINGARSLIAAAVIGLYLAARHHRVVLNRYTVFGAICYTGVTSLFVAANKLTTAANAIVLQYAAPVWIIVMMYLFFRQKPGKRELAAVAAVLAGIACFFFDSLSAGNMLGNILAVLSGIFFAGLFILNSFPEGDTLSALLLGQLVSGLALTPLVSGETDFSAPVLLAVLALGLFQVGLAYIFFSEGTARTHPVTASLVCTIEPILNPILTALILGETVTPLSAVGAAIVVVSVLAYNIAKADKNA